MHLWKTKLATLLNLIKLSHKMQTSNNTGNWTALKCVVCEIFSKFNVNCTVSCRKKLAYLQPFVNPELSTDLLRWLLKRFLFSWLTRTFGFYCYTRLCDCWVKAFQNYYYFYIQYCVQQRCRNVDRTAATFSALACSVTCMKKLLKVSGI